VPWPLHRFLPNCQSGTAQKQGWKSIAGMRDKKVSCFARGAHELGAPTAQADVSPPRIGLEGRTDLHLDAEFSVRVEL
jgi:hypothetical protein